MRDDGVNKYIKLVGFGFLIWLIPFLVSFLIFPLRNENRVLFESIMPVVVVFVVVVFSLLYFKKLEKNFLHESIIACVIWFLISILIDLIMFLPETPWHMSIIDYMMDIGLTYVIILIIPIGWGFLLNKH
jgi:hypothetical protein